MIFVPLVCNAETYMPEGCKNDVRSPVENGWKIGICRTLGLKN